MDYSMLKDVIHLLEEFENDSNPTEFTQDIEGFKKWIAFKNQPETEHSDFTYEGMEKGRSLESVISTLLVHLSRYAKSYSKSVIHNSVFTTQDDFIYLITLKTFGKMSKMDLIKRNVHDKSNGIQIINRLIKQGFILQKEDELDKRSKNISITKEGENALEDKMNEIRRATKIVSGNLSKEEKIQLIGLLDKLDHFHLEVYNKNLDHKELIKYFDDIID